MTNATTLIRNKEKELAFLKHFEQADYQLVDFSFIESLTWPTLTQDDLQQMTERSFGNITIRFLRYVTTLQINYYVISNYPSPNNKVAYSGPIIRDNIVNTQLGIEHYNLYY